MGKHGRGTVEVNRRRLLIYGSTGGTRAHRYGPASQAHWPTVAVPNTPLARWRGGPLLDNNTEWDASALLHRKGVMQIGTEALVHGWWTLGTLQSRLCMRTPTPPDARYTACLRSGS